MPSETWTLAQIAAISIHERDFVSIIGPSGCSRTMVVNVIAGPLEPNAGTMLFRDRPVPGLRGRVGYMMQKDLLFPWRTVLQNVMLGLEMRATDPREATDTAWRHLAQLGLGDFENADPKPLSGGMRQRGPLIRTLITDLDVLLLDEPSSALDDRTRLYLDGVLLEAVTLSKRVSVLAGLPSRVKAVHAVALGDRPIGAQQPVLLRALHVSRRALHHAAGGRRRGPAARHPARRALPQRSAAAAPRAGASGFSTARSFSPPSDHHPAREAAPPEG